MMTRPPSRSTGQILRSGSSARPGCRRVWLGWSCRRPKRFTEAAMPMLTSPARNNGWQLYGQPTLTFDQKRGEVICGQVITKVVEGKTYDPELDLSKL